MLAHEASLLSNMETRLTILFAWLLRLMLRKRFLQLKLWINKSNKGCAFKHLSLLFSLKNSFHLCKKFGIMHLSFQKEFCVKCLSKDMSADGSQFQQNLKIQIQAKRVEAYNWVISICLKYVSLPWNMVNSLWRAASEPWAWREFYKNFMRRSCHCLPLILPSIL